MVHRLDELRHKDVDLLLGHIGHHDDVRNVLLARELPAADKGLVARPLEHDGRREVIEARAHASEVRPPAVQRQGSTAKELRAKKKDDRTNQGRSVRSKPKDKPSLQENRFTRVVNVKQISVAIRTVPLSRQKQTRLTPKRKNLYGTRKF